MQKIKGYSFYHSKKHDPLDIMKTTAVIYQDTKPTFFLGKKNVYFAKLHAVNNKSEAYRSLDLGGKENNTREFASLEEISENVRGFVEKLFKDAVALECCQVLSKNIIEETAEQVFVYDQPEYTPDFSITHEDDIEEIEKMIDEEVANLQKSGNPTKEQVEDLVIKLKARGIDANFRVIKVPKSKATNNLIASDPVIPIVDTPVEKMVETVQNHLSDEEEYKALCKKFGKKNIDKLKHELESKNKKKKSV